MRGNRAKAIEAIDALVLSGGLLGNYKPGGPAFGKKQAVWLPRRAKSAIG
jgi:hypothetical protein